MALPGIGSAPSLPLPPDAENLLVFVLNVIGPSGRHSRCRRGGTLLLRAAERGAPSTTLWR